MPSCPRHKKTPNVCSFVLSCSSSSALTAASGFAAAPESLVEQLICAPELRSLDEIDEVVRFFLLPQERVQQWTFQLAGLQIWRNGQCFHTLSSCSDSVIYFLNRRKVSCTFTGALASALRRRTYGGSTLQENLGSHCEKKLGCLRLHTVIARAGSIFGGAPMGN